MDALATRARFAPHLSKSVVVTLVLLTCANTYAASHRTTNFIVTAKTKELAVAIAEAAETLSSRVVGRVVGLRTASLAGTVSCESESCPSLGRWRCNELSI